MTSLPPGGSGRFEPVSLSTAAVRDELGGKPERVELKQARNAVWCGQFVAMNQEPKSLTTPELVTDIWLQAAQPGISYVSLGNSFSGGKEAKRRFEVVFRKVSPGKSGFAVEFDVVDHEARDTSTRYRGAMTLPPVQDRRSRASVACG